MKIAGLGLLLLSALAVIGTIIWVIVTGAEYIPVIFWVIGGLAIAGTILLMLVAIRDRMRQQKEDSFERRDN